MTPWANRLAIALVLSIGVNVLLAGYILGYGLRPPLAAVGPTGTGMGLGRSLGRGPGMGRGRGLGSRAGNGNGRAALRAAIELRGDDLRARRLEIDKARDTVRATLGQEPLDRAALEQALATLRAQTAQGQELTHQAITEAAVSATPERRRDLANDFGPIARGM